MRIKGEQNRESRKHTESLFPFPEVRGHLITVHVHVQFDGRKTIDDDLKERPLIAGSRCYYTPTLVSRVCVEARVTLKSLMLFGRRYVAHCLPLAPAPAELELDPPLSTSSTSQAFDTFCCKYLEPPLLGSFISISRLCASSTSASVAVGFTLRIMRAWVTRKGTIIGAQEEVLHSAGPNEWWRRNTHLALQQASSTGPQASLGCICCCRCPAIVWSVQVHGGREQLCKCPRAYGMGA